MESRWLRAWYSKYSNDSKCLDHSLLSAIAGIYNKKDPKGTHHALGSFYFKLHYLEGTALSLRTRKMTMTSTRAIKSRPGAPASSMKPVLGRAVDVAMIVPVETAI